MDAIQSDSPALASNLLRGAENIARYVYGEEDLEKRTREIYRNPADLPLFYMGTNVCAFKTSLRAHFAALEASAKKKKTTQKTKPSPAKPKVKPRPRRPAAEASVAADTS